MGGYSGVRLVFLFDLSGYGPQTDLRIENYGCFTEALFFTRSWASKNKSAHSSIFGPPSDSFVPDSHDQLFFECHLKPYMRMSNIPPSLSSIVTFLVPLASKKSARVIIFKQVIDSIISTVRLKPLSCRFKKTENVQRSYRLCNDLVDALWHVTCVLEVVQASA
ncbi:hypothetical protein Tco_1302922 [Tanacetum coccineum]